MVTDARGGERRRQHLAVEVRAVAAVGLAAHVDQHLHAVGQQERDKLFYAVIAVTDREDLQGDAHCWPRFICLVHWDDRYARDAAQA